MDEKVTMAIEGDVQAFSSLIDSIKEKRINYFHVFHLIFYIFILIYYLYNNNEIPYKLQPFIAVDMVIMNIYSTIKSSSVKKS
ncbi:hypothetical protein [Clostridium butyricum]|uniref:hypothetical protein n=1 Tax=Clostridium butyricum TaxID=1492 RepID=UPI00374ED73D